MILNKFNKFSFKSENLVVDYFEFKFDALSQYRKQKIVEFFFKLGFNSFDVDKKYREYLVLLRFKTILRTNMIFNLW